jgi:hypothetical protein
MEYGSEISSSDLVGRMRLRGLLMCVALPLVLLLGTWLLRNSLPVSEGPENHLQIYIILAAAFFAPITVYFSMRLSTRRVRSFVLQSAQQGRSVAELIGAQCTTLFGVALAPAWMGLAAIFLGAGFLYFSILIAWSLLAYLFLRPKDQEIENLLREVDRLQQASGSSSAWSANRET